MTPRATTSASNWFRRILCPGSEQAELGMPDDEASAAAERGTLLHAHDASGTEAEEVCEQEILERNVMLRERFLFDTLAKLGIPTIGTKCKVVVEQRYSLKDEHGDDVIGIDGLSFGGQPDRLLYFPDFRLLFIFDSKFGRLRVPAAEVNWQLAMYACMVGDPDYGDFECDRVFVAITQPMARPNFSAAEYDVQTLAAAKAEILRHWRAIKAPNQPRNASFDACHYCRAKASCPAALAIAKESAELKISELPIDQLEALAPKIELAETVAAAYWRRLKYIAEKHPHLLTRFELKEGAEMRSVDPVESSNAYGLLTQAGLCDATEFTSACKLSLPTIEGIVAKKHKIKTDEAKLKVETTLGDLIQRKRKGASVVEKKQQPLLKQ